MNEAAISDGAGSAPVAKNHWLLFAFIIFLFMFSNHHWAQTGGNLGDAFESRVDAVTQVRAERRVMFLLLGLWGYGSLLFGGFSRLKFSGVVAQLLTFFCLLAFASILWAIDPGLTAKRIVVFVMFCLAALAFAMRTTPRDVPLLVFFGSSFYLIWGVIAELYFGSFMPFYGGYRFSGTQIANLQAINCSFLLISSVVLRKSSKSYKWVFQIGMAVGLIFLILTKSRTSFAASIVTLVVYKMVTSKASRRITAVFFIALALSTSFLILGESAVPILGSGINLGRSTEGSATLNGRIWLWMECRGYAGQRKLLGYGFNGFWTPDHVDVISHSQGWALAEAHSVFFDVVLELGLVGAITFVLLLFYSILISRENFRRTGDYSWVFFLCFLVYYVANGCLESVLIHPGFYSFVSMLIFANLAFAEHSTIPFPKMTESRGTAMADGLIVTASPGEKPKGVGRY